MFRAIHPMLAQTCRRAFDSDRHIFELKWDGYRCLAFITGGEVRLQSRNLRDLTPAYPELDSMPRWVKAREAILDGELVAFRDGRPDFGALQDRQGAVVYVAFDLLHLDGRDLMPERLSDRRDALRETIAAGAAALVFSEHVTGQGRAFFQAVTGRGLEGIMAKEVSSPYLPGRRTRHWLKVRHVKTLEAVIVGYTGEYPHAPRSLLLARREDGGLRYVGRVGTGYSAGEGKVLLQKLRPRHGTPLEERVPGAIHWVHPELRCRVEYLELTGEGLLRHPVYRGLVDG